ncbi:futalosine hydrolase [Streptomyces platensis]|uniref:futalosine hydrolase n=1 Tax=Streptomyces platensis TaxID=58346 RepID=UPI001F47106C|nr:futalosine hydrolase [Streptomyces platensis]MCF3146761.1 futalosine hydrolase [Streptomyces platensis]
MRRVLVVTAVAAERDAVCAVAGSCAAVTLPGGQELRRADGLPVALDALAAGVGPAAAAAGTATALTAAALAGQPYDLVVSAGIGGGFSPTLGSSPTLDPARAGGPPCAGGPPPGAPLGSVVVADAIVAADLGAETPDGFLPVTELGFGTVAHRPDPALVRTVAAAADARAGTIVTVSTVTGSAARAAELAARHPGVLAEAMEGFGVAEAAAAHGVPVLEIRAVSNAVGPRDRAAWRIGDALAALTGAFRTLPGALTAPAGPAPEPLPRPTSLTREEPTPLRRTP